MIDRARPVIVGALGTLLGCGGGVPESSDAPAPAPPATAAATLVPSGYGTLRQDAFTVALRTGDLLVKVTPLAEELIRLAAPDTYERLRDIAQTNRAQARESASRAGIQDDPLLFLVSFHTFAPQSEYTPTDLQILSEGRLYRSIDIIPITPGFGTQWLHQEKTQIAIYAFDPTIDLDIPMAVRYGPAQSEAWERIIAVLEAERARVLARTEAEGTG